MKNMGLAGICRGHLSRASAKAAKALPSSWTSTVAASASLTLWWTPLVSKLTFNTSSENHLAVLLGLSTLPRKKPPGSPSRTANSPNLLDTDFRHFLAVLSRTANSPNLLDVELQYYLAVLYRTAISPNLPDADC
eukprot:SAG11_NODE_1385_length_5070_cov_3.950915_1_plen_135_part_00